MLLASFTLNSTMPASSSAGPFTRFLQAIISPLVVAARARSVNRAFPSCRCWGTHPRHDPTPRIPRHAPAAPAGCRDRAWPRPPGPGRRPRRPRRRPARPDPGDRGARPPLRQPDRPGRRLRQGCGGRPAADAARLRLRRGRHRHPPAAARQPAPPAVPAGGGCRRHQPHGLQQRRAGGLSRPPRRPAAAAAGPLRRQYRRQQGRRRPRARLPRALCRAGAPQADYVVVNVSSPNTPGLRDLQGEERLAADPRRHRRGLPERATRRCWSRSPPTSPMPRSARWSRPASRTASPASSSRTPPSPGRRRCASANRSQAGGLSGAPLREPRHRGAAAMLPPGPGPAAAGRRRRHRHGGRCAGEDQGRRQPGAALYRLRLCRPGAGAGAEARPRRAAAAGRLSRVSPTRSAWTPEEQRHGSSRRHRPPGGSLRRLRARPLGRGPRRQADLPRRRRGAGRAEIPRQARGLPDQCAAPRLVRRQHAGPHGPRPRAVRRDHVLRRDRLDDAARPQPSLLRPARQARLPYRPRARPLGDRGGCRHAGRRPGRGRLPAEHRPRPGPRLGRPVALPPGAGSRRRASTCRWSASTPTATSWSAPTA